jgi:hypothetical protein
MYAADGVQGYAPWAGRVSAGDRVVVVLGLAGLIVVGRVVVVVGPLAPLACPGAAWGVLAHPGAFCRPWSSPAWVEPSEPELDLPPEKTKYHFHKLYRCWKKRARVSFDDGEIMRSTGQQRRFHRRRR